MAVAFNARDKEKIGAVPALSKRFYTVAPTDCYNCIKKGGCNEMQATPAFRFVFNKEYHIAQQPTALEGL